jgi:phosphatidylglycerol lysyltransferase
LIWSLQEISDRYNGRALYYEVGPEQLQLYLDLGLGMLKLGEEARVPLEMFGLDGSSRKGLRYIHHRLAREGCRFDVIPSEAVSPLLPELRQVSEAWLTMKNTREKGFSMGCFDEHYLRWFPVGVVRQNGRITAFANIWTGAAKEEISIDLMRYLPDAPRNVMEYLLVELMIWGKQQGYRWFSLGMAPFSGLDDHLSAPLWNKLGAFVFRHGEHFYNFQGLRRFKEKFNPVWEPRYLASPSSFALPRMLADIASLISGGFKGILAK